MIDHDHALPVSRQVQLVGIARSSAYYEPRPVSEADLKLMRRLAWRDNVFVERVWRSVKYEEVYLKAYETVSHARRSIGDYLNLYNQKRPHSSLADRTPDEAYV